MGQTIGAVGSERAQAFAEKKKVLSKAKNLAETLSDTPNMLKKQGLKINQDGVSRNVLDLLAPDMMISVSTHKPKDVENYDADQAIAWVGKAVTNRDLISELSETNTPIIGTVGTDWDAYRAEAADILVTDYAFNHRPITGLTRQNRDLYQNCLLD